MATSAAFRKAEMTLRKWAMAYPEATEDFPWDHRAIKVKGKMFVIFSGEPTAFRVTVKLPESNAHALALSFTEPTGYGMGKHGWVTATFAPDDEIPLEMLREWMDESFRAVAPKKLVAVLDGESDPPSKKPRKAKAVRKGPTR